VNADKVAAVVEPLRLRWQEQPEHDESAWPRELWNELVDAGGTLWGIAPEFGGGGWSSAELLAAGMELARGHLTTAFIWTQFLAAIQRLDKGPPALCENWLPRLARCETFATVGISHLTTSRSLGPGPAVRAELGEGGVRITGSIPWVTGLTQADVIVAGATIDDGRQVLVALETSLPGVERAEPLSLLAVSGSMTGRVHLHDVFVPTANVIAGPVENVLKAIGSGGAGSLMTSAVATGHALAAWDYLDRITDGGDGFDEMMRTWRGTLLTLRDDLLSTAKATSSSPHTAESLRVRSTTLALQLSQALLTASKGAGFVTGHPAERLVREAMFFLVWSCPQSVAGEVLRGFSEKAQG
jgi:alkylation response protein AidB-like acyl-CoA dehydrogenase